MSEPKFKKIIKERNKYIVKGTWPFDHPLVLAIKELTPDTDECIEVNLSQTDVAALNRRLRLILPEGYRITMRTFGKTLYQDERNKNVKTRCFWLITKPEDRLNIT